MRRIACTLVVVAVSVLVGVAPASGNPAPSERPGHQVTGTFAGTSTYEISQDPACNFALEQYTGTYDPDRRGAPGGTYALDVCVSFGAPQGLGVDGTFVVSGRGGLTLSGTVSGFLTSIPDGDGLALHLTLTVTGSEAPGRPIRGTITATGIRTEAGGFGTAAESGTFTADLHRTRR